MMRSRFVTRLFLGASSTCALTLLSVMSATAVVIDSDTAPHEPVHLDIDYRDCAIDITPAGLRDPGDYTVTVTDSTAFFESYALTIDEGQDAGTVHHGLHNASSDGAFTIDLLRITESEPEFVVSTVLYVDPELLAACFTTEGEGEGEGEDEPEEVPSTEDDAISNETTETPESESATEISTDTDTEQPGPTVGKPDTHTSHKPASSLHDEVTRAVNAVRRTPPGWVPHTQTPNTIEPSGSDQVSEKETEKAPRTPSREDETPPTNIMVGKPKGSDDLAAVDEYSHTAAEGGFNSDLITVGGLTVAIFVLGVASMAISTLNARR